MKLVPEPTEKYKVLRSQILNPQAWRKLGLGPTEKLPNVWGAVMEVGYPQTVVTLVCLVNNTVSFYFGNDDGIVGGGAQESVRMRSEEFILAVETALKKLNKTKATPLPEVGRIRFYALTYSGILTTQVNKQIDSENHELFPLFRSGHEVIAALRAVDEKTPLQRVDLKN